MKALILTMAAVVCSAALTGCSGGMGSSIFGQGARCGGGCSPAAAPSYDYAPGSYGYEGAGCSDGCGECACGSNEYAGYDSGMDYGSIHGEAVPYDGGIQGGMDPNGGGYIVPGSESTRTVPVPSLQQGHPAT